MCFALGRYILDYAEDSLKLYPDMSKVIFASFMDGHEATGEAVGWMDDALADFLERRLPPMLNDTIVFILSDHGNHMNPLYVEICVNSGISSTKDCLKGWNLESCAIGAWNASVDATDPEMAGNQVPSNKNESNNESTSTGDVKGYLSCIRGDWRLEGVWRGRRKVAERIVQPVANRAKARL